MFLETNMKPEILTLDQKFSKSSVRQIRLLVMKSSLENLKRMITYIIPKEEVTNDLNGASILAGKNSPAGASDDG